MKKLSAALLIYFGLANAALAQWLGPPNAVLCNQIATFSGVAVATQLVAPVTGKQVFFCGFQATNSSATTYNFTFSFGSGATCGTNTVTFTPAINVTTNSVTDHAQYGTTSSAVGSGLCVTPSNAAISGMVYYAVVPTIGY
jgi:hypothetical protein